MALHEEIEYGHCHCGCGGLTTISLSGVTRNFIAYHHNKLPRRGPIEDKYKVDPESGCWLWLMRLSPDGYGAIRADLTGRITRAHQYLYEKHKGPVPDGMELDHTCSVRSCVNPAHLEPVTHTENVRRGRSALLTIDDAQLIRSRSNCGDSSRALANLYSTTTESIRRIVTGKSWKEAA